MRTAKKVMKKSNLLIWQTEQWEKGFAAASARSYKYGDCNATSFSTWPEDDSDGYKLGIWISRQRGLKKEGKLPSDRVERLEQIGITWNMQEKRSWATRYWETGFAAASAWSAKHGTCNAPGGSTWPENDPDGYPIGSWIRYQRVLKKSDRLSSDRIDRLQEIGISWTPLKEIWEIGFEAAIEWKKSHGNCNPPSKATWPEDDPNGFNLGDWISRQRKKQQSGTLSLDHVRRLEQLGICWYEAENGLSYRDELWEKGYKFAVERSLKYGGCNAPGHTYWPEGDPNGFGLGAWIATQRARRRAGKLSLDRISRLEKLGMHWGGI